MSSRLSPDIIRAAQNSMRKWKVPASISLAQFALESAWGTKTSGTHNYFGMKAKKGEPGIVCRTHEFFKGQMVETSANFRCFASPEEAFEAHAQLLATAPCYHKARSCLDYQSYAHALTGVYATDPHYGDKLVDLIERSKLAQYDTVPA